MRVDCAHELKHVSLRKVSRHAKIERSTEYVSSERTLARQIEVIREILGKTVSIM